MLSNYYVLIILYNALHFLMYSLLVNLVSMKVNVYIHTVYVHVCMTACVYERANLLYTSNKLFSSCCLLINKIKKTSSMV